MNWGGEAVEMMVNEGKSTQSPNEGRNRCVCL